MLINYHTTYEKFRRQPILPALFLLTEALSQGITRKIYITWEGCYRVRCCHLQPSGFSLCLVSLCFKLKLLPIYVQPCFNPCQETERRRKLINMTKLLWAKLKSTFSRAGVFQHHLVLLKHEFLSKSHVYFGKIFKLC